MFWTHCLLVKTLLDVGHENPSDSGFSHILTVFLDCLFLGHLEVMG